MHQQCKKRYKSKVMKLNERYDEWQNRFSWLFNPEKSPVPSLSLVNGRGGELLPKQCFASIPLQCACSMVHPLQGQLSLSSTSWTFECYHAGTSVYINGRSCESANRINCKHVANRKSIIHGNGLPRGMQVKNKKFGDPLCEQLSCSSRPPLVVESVL